MTQEVVVRLRDDFDQSLGTQDDPVETHDLILDGEAVQLELSGSNYELMRGDLKRWLAVAHEPAKKRRQPRRVDAPKRKSPQGWVTEIHAWATEHGYDWDDPDTRRGIRHWAQDVLGQSCRTGVIPRDVMEAHYERVGRQTNLRGPR
jgi:Lsr2